MSSLKQEMRRKYETHSSMAFFENNSGFEEGLLEKIMNLAYASLAPYSHTIWDITAVKSPVLLQKLSKAADDRRIIECAVSLIICERSQIGDSIASHELNVRSVLHELELLSLSIGYAAKYYCIDYFLVKSFDPEKVVREFPMNRLVPTEIIGLGCFREEAAALLRRNYYSDTVRVI